MYELGVYYPGDTIARSMVEAKRADEALGLIPKLLAEHAGCERVVVMLSGLRLFSVDCAGNRLP